MAHADESIPDSTTVALGRVFMVTVDDGHTLVLGTLCFLRLLVRNTLAASTVVRSAVFGIPNK